jgi:SpoVK/Ycf46/Vps4 family AAA+-type ATPase
MKTSFGMIADRVADLLAVDGLEEPIMAETAIDNLVMEKNNKDLIKGIARIYTDRDQVNRFSADFIHGKGEGQIILLHGPPGTGKTLTAGTFHDMSGRNTL